MAGGQGDLRRERHDCLAQPVDNCRQHRVHRTEIQCGGGSGSAVSGSKNVSCRNGDMESGATKDNDDCCHRRQMGRTLCVPQNSYPTDERQQHAGVDAIGAMALRWPYSTSRSAAEYTVPDLTSRSPHSCRQPQPSRAWAVPAIPAG